MPKKPPKAPKAPPKTPDPEGDPPPVAFHVGFLQPSGGSRTLLSLVPGATFWGESLSPDEVTTLVRTPGKFNRKLRLVLISEMAANDRRVGNLSESHAALEALFQEFSAVVSIFCKQATQRIEALEARVLALERHTMIQ